MNPGTILTAVEALQAVINIAQESLKLYNAQKISSTQLQAIWQNAGINLQQAEAIWKTA